MCDPLEFWASDYVYLHTFRAFSQNTFLVEENRVEVLELNQARAKWCHQLPDAWSVKLHGTAPS